jgi:hypothetical protein
MERPTLVATGKPTESVSKGVCMGILSVEGMLYCIGYGVVFLLTLGLIGVAAWYLRWMAAVLLFFLPAMMVFWFAWAWLVVIPVGLLADGSALDRKVVVISHWLNDANWAVLKFGFLLSYHAFMLAGEAARFATGGA